MRAMRSMFVVAFWIEEGGIRVCSRMDEYRDEDDDEWYEDGKVMEWPFRL